MEEEYLIFLHGICDYCGEEFNIRDLCQRYCSKTHARKQNRRDSGTPTAGQSSARSNLNKRHQVCKNKRRYINHVDASIAARWIYRKSNILLFPYDCLFCDFWHHTGDINSSHADYRTDVCKEDIPIILGSEHFISSSSPGDDESVIAKRFGNLLNSLNE